jgi:hypothetical protein
MAQANPHEGSVGMQPWRQHRIGLQALCGAVVLATMIVRPAAAAPALEPDTVQVFFSDDPESLNDFTAVFPVARDVPSGSAIEGAIAALIAGPSASEHANGFFSDFQAIITGNVSTCKGEDFVLMVAQGVATIQLCRQTSSAGIGQDARAEAEINATVMQFPGVAKVVVLGPTGHCLFDESGMDLCLT